MSGQLHAPAALPPGESPPRYPLHRKLGGHQSPSGSCGEEKIMHFRERTRNFQPLDDRYNDWVIPTPLWTSSLQNDSNLMLLLPCYVQILAFSLLSVLSLPIHAFPLGIKNQRPHPYNKTGKIIILYTRILIFMILDKRWETGKHKILDWMVASCLHCNLLLISSWM
jgi:hypothetical protein